ncbi:MAG: NTP transferase domain-containing protein, partial [Magnetovibrio sp.]|nr:NTP transferase domain-containing protein [Magnetovibrio sp.]
MTEKFRVAAIVLAAGLSRRAGIRNKLLAPVGGKPMVRRSTEAVLASGAAPVFVVTGHQAAAVATAHHRCDRGRVLHPRGKDGRCP